MTRIGWAAALVALVLAGPAFAETAASPPDDDDDQKGICEKDKSFKPTEANNFKTCRTLWGPIGTPQYANDDVDATPVCHSAYVLSHNNVNKTPDWVLERLRRAQFAGGEDRPTIKFTYERSICKEARAVDKQYAGSKMDRGHQAPSADFSSSVDLMKESFILSNAVPQQGEGFNRHIWKEFEDLVRGLAKERGELFVITGPINRDEGDEITIKANQNPCGNEIKLEGPKGRAEICGKDKKCAEGKGVTIPIALFKIIYDAKNKRTNAYILPNIDHRPLDKSKNSFEYLKKYRVAVRTVEQHTGLQFLRALPARERRQQIDECIATMFSRNL